MALHGGHSEYLSTIFNPQRHKEAVKKVAAKLSALSAEGLKFDTIAFTGNSGAGIAYPLSSEYGYRITCIRKDECTHGRYVESSNDTIETYVIVDDFICSGATIKNILKTFDNLAKCVGIILYMHRQPTYRNFLDIPIFTISNEEEEKDAYKTRRPMQPLSEPELRQERISVSNLKYYDMSQLYGSKVSKSSTYMARNLPRGCRTW